MRGAQPQAAIRQTIERDRIVRRGERALIACSGGPDSVALAALLHGVAKPMHLQLALAHVNHGLRGSAWQDECVAMRVAAALELPLDVVALEGGARDETSLREARYAALLERARRRECSAIVTAHHAEDQSETVLLALFRGAGQQGLQGMRPRRPLAEGIDLVRPLLGIDSAALRQVCDALAMPYAVDPTNAELDLRRNAVRDALERLRPLFAGLDRAIARTAVLAGDEAEAADAAGWRAKVRSELLAEGELRDVDFAHVEAAVRAIAGGSTGSFIMKPGVRLHIEAGRIAGINRA
jgi:tRNA(Ile)-lysidine synthase